MLLLDTEPVADRERHRVISFAARLRPRWARACLQRDGARLGGARLGGSGGGIGPRNYVAGDHCDTRSVQDALTFGRRAAHAVLGHLAVNARPAC